MLNLRVCALLPALMAAAASPVFAQGSVPVPQPFPGASAPTKPAPAPAPPRPASPIPTQAPQSAQPEPATPAGPPELAGIPIYPTAEFLASYDAGSGQRYYLFGTDLSYDEIVSYYRTVLKDGGHEIYKDPATRQFDLGKYRDDSMAFPPSVVVKDYTWNNSPGYLFVSGTTSKRFKTIIQIVPPTPDR